MTRRALAITVMLLTAIGWSPLGPATALVADQAVDPAAADLPATDGSVQALDHSDNVEVVARIPEASTAIALAFDDDVLYVSTITGIFSYDISDPTRPQLLGVLPEYIWQNEDMAIDTDRKLLFISRDPRGVTGIAAPPELRFFGAVEIIDIADPRLMRHVNVIPLPAGHTSTCVAATDRGGCDFLWTGGPYANELFGPYGRPIYATDIRNPSSPVQCPEPINTGLYDRPDGEIVDGYAHDVQVDHQGVAWVSSEGGVHGYWTFGERHDPTTGELREATPCDPVPYGGGGTPSEATPSRFMHNSALNPAITIPDDPDSAGHVLFATEEALSSNCATSGRFATYDVRDTLDGSGFTDPSGTRMTVLDTWTPEGAEGATGCASAHYFDDRGDGVLAYAFYGQGTRFLDASDPTDIRQIGWYRPDGSNAYAAYHHRDLWWVADQGSGVHVLRFEGTPTRPQPEGDDGAATPVLPSPTVEAPPLPIVAQQRWEAANRGDPATGMVCLLSPLCAQPRTEPDRWCGRNSDMPELPLHGVTDTQLPPWPESATTALDAAVAGDDPEAALREVAAAHPAFLPAWAELAERSLAAGDPIAAYAFARVGYHRGLDAIRGAGWRGQGPVPWDHEPNRGFLRSLDALRRAALAIGEQGEPERCRDFLIQLDPDDHLQVMAE